MSELNFDIVSTAVCAPGQSAKLVSELLPNPSVENHILNYKEASKILGRKGLRYKDQATLLALVVAHNVLNARELALTEAEKLRTSVIVSSNLSNIDTVVENAKTIASDHVNATSAMALPNASSNAVSASIAIVNGLKGPNLMLCNGADSGLDAIKLAMDLMRANRADRVLVVGVEVENDYVKSVFHQEKSRFNGAAGYLIEARRSSSPLTRPLAQLVPATTSEIPLSATEVFKYCGDASGATGVLQVVLATEYAILNEPRYLSIDKSTWKVNTP